MLIALRKLFRKFLLAKLNYLIYQYRFRHRIVKGPPGGVDLSTLNELCLDHLGESLRHVSHVHISYWKSFGAFRLLLQTERGRYWSLIYKNAIYDPTHIPALTGLPIRPGPPEYFIYSHRQGALAKYLPAVYLCLEVTPGRHYQYLLEDVMQEYRKVQYDSTDILNAAAELPALHRAMSEWSLVAGQDHLLRFDREFSTALLDYVRENLERYLQETANKAVSEICKLWPQIYELHQRQEFYDLQTICPIHGDYNTANIYIHVRDMRRIKVIDWEWAGLGVAHADLVSLLKRVDPETEQRALASFYKQVNGLSFDEHKRLYRWCQLERGLFDVAFLAKQQMESPRKVDWVSDYIQASMQQVLDAYQELV